MSWLRALPLVIIVFALYFLLGAARVARLSISTNGRYSTEPGAYWVVVKLDPKPEDRWLDVIADGSIYSSQGFSLAGERSFRIKQVLIKDLTAGCYEVRAEVRSRDQDGPIIARAVVPGPLTVLGMGVDAASCNPAMP